MTWRRDNPFRISRRDLLRGAGAATLALPILPGLHAAAQTGVFPKRVVFVYFPEGVQPDHWWPSAFTSPTNFQLSATSSLQPLVPHFADLTLISGLEHRSTFSSTENLHDFVMKHIFTGGEDSPSITYNGKTTPGGISIDRFLGEHIGAGKAKAYQFGVRANTNTEVQRELSFNAKGQGIEAISNPFTVLHDLFNDVWIGDTWNPFDIGNVAQGGECSTFDTGAMGTITKGPASMQEAPPPAPKDAWRLALVDKLKNDYARLRCTLGKDGKAKLDAHIAGLRQIEQQMTAMATSVAGGLPALDGCYAALVKEDSGYLTYNEWYDDLSRMQIALLTGSLASDVVRVATLQYGASTATMSFPYLNIDDSIKQTVLHTIAHQQVDASDADKPKYREAMRAVATWQMQQIALLISSLKAIPEGDGTLLDNTAVVITSDMSYGATHDKRDLPVIIAGGCGGALKKGMFLNFKASGGRPFADALVTVANAVGVAIPKFGVTQVQDNSFGNGTLPGCDGPITELLI